MTPIQIDITMSRSYISYSATIIPSTTMITYDPESSWDKYAYSQLEWI